MNDKILLLEDDISLVDGLVYTLKRNGFFLQAVKTVEKAKQQLVQNDYDLLLLDVTLPDGTGFELCNWVRQRGNQVPIIFLTASDEEVNIIRGLDSGGDDLSLIHISRSVIWKALWILFTVPLLKQV